MRFKMNTYMCGLTAMLAMTLGVPQTQLSAKQTDKKHRQEKHKSSSSSSFDDHKQKKCCKKTVKLLKQVNQTTQQDLAVDEEILSVVNNINDIVSCSDPIHITQAMVTEGLVITEPGVYRFCENITFTPAPAYTASAKNSANTPPFDVKQLNADILKLAEKQNGRLGFSEVAKLVHDRCSTNSKQMATSLAVVHPPAAITVAASNVYIDMMNFTLESDLAAGAIGFLLIEDHENITITNGTITQFQVAGIYANIEDSTPQRTLGNLTFKNLTIIDNGDPFAYYGTTAAAGINLTAPEIAGFNIQFTHMPTSFKYSNILIKDCSINNNASAGIAVWNVTDLTIQDSAANGSYMTNAPFNIISGVAFGFSRNIRLLHSTFDNTRMEQGGAYVCSGAGFLASENVYANMCSFNNTLTDGTGFSVFTVGILAGTSKNLFFENCQFNNPVSLSEAGTVNCFHHSDSINAEVSDGPVKFVHCQFNGTRYTKGPGFGGAVGVDFITHKDVMFENCQSTNHICDVEGRDAIGFSIGTSYQDPITADIASSRNITFRNCDASDIFSAGIARGFYYHADAFDGKPDIADLTNITVDNVVVSRVYGDNESSGIFAGADDATNQICKNVVVKNSVVSEIGYDNGVGIKMQAVDSPFLYNNIVQNCSTGILLTKNGSTYTTNGTIQDNKVSNCSIYGYRDVSPVTTSAWVQNLSFKNSQAYVVNWGCKAPVQCGYEGFNTWYNIQLPCKPPRKHHSCSSSSSSSSSSDTSSSSCSSES